MANVTFFRVPEGEGSYVMFFFSRLAVGKCCIVCCDAVLMISRFQTMRAWKPQVEATCNLLCKLESRSQLCGPWERGLNTKAKPHLWEGGVLHGSGSSPATCLADGLSPCRARGNCIAGLPGLPAEASVASGGHRLSQVFEARVVSLLRSGGAGRFLRSKARPSRLLRGPQLSRPYKTEWRDTGQVWYDTTTQGGSPAFCAAGLEFVHVYHFRI